MTTQSITVARAIKLEGKLQSKLSSLMPRNIGRIHRLDEAPFRTLCEKRLAFDDSVTSFIAALEYVELLRIKIAESNYAHGMGPLMTKISIANKKLAMLENICIEQHPVMSEQTLLSEMELIAASSRSTDSYGIHRDVIDVNLITDLAYYRDMRDSTKRAIAEMKDELDQKNASTYFTLTDAEYQGILQIVNT